MVSVREWHSERAKDYLVKGKMLLRFPFNKPCLHKTQDFYGRNWRPQQTNRLRKGNLLWRRADQLKMWPVSHCVWFLFCFQNLPNMDLHHAEPLIFLCQQKMYFLVHASHCRVRLEVWLVLVYFYSYTRKMTTRYLEFIYIFTSLNLKIITEIFIKVGDTKRAHQLQCSWECCRFPPRSTPLGQFSVTRTLFSFSLLSLHGAINLM